jgi:hypothetical protein
MAPVLRAGSNVATTGSGTGLTVAPTVPSGAVAGDLILIWCVSVQANTGFSAPNFAAQLPNLTNASGMCQLLYYTMTGAEGWTPGTTTITVTGSETTVDSATICAVGGWSGFDPPNFGQVNPGSLSINCSGIVTTQPNDLLLWFGFAGAGSGVSLSTLSVPAEFTAAISQVNTTRSSATNYGVIFGSATQAVAGATGAQNGSQTTSLGNGAQLIALAGQPWQTWPSPTQPLAAPGYLSPAAWDFVPAAPQAINDAPPTTPVPYFAGLGAVTNSTGILTFTVQNSTNPGDAIVVLATGNNNGGTPISCTDTQGNSYSLTGGNFSGNMVTGFWVAQKTTALTGSNAGTGTPDTITVTFAATGNFGKIAIVCGVPASTVSAVTGTGDYLTYFQSSRASLFGPTAVQLTSTAAVAGTTQVLIGCLASAPAAGPPSFPQGWTPLGTIDYPGTSGIGGYLVVIYKILTASGPAGTNLVNGSRVMYGSVGGAGNMSVGFVSLGLETRFAPNKPGPDMPPGNLSPGAWQFMPLPRGGHVTATGVYETPALTTSALTKQPAKTIATTATTTGAVFFGLVRRFAATVVTTATGILKRGRSVLWTVGVPLIRWVAGSPLIRWMTGTPR